MVGKFLAVFLILLIIFIPVSAFVPKIGDLDDCIIPSWGRGSQGYGFVKNTYFLNDSTVLPSDYEILLLEPNTVVSDTDSVTLTVSDGMKLIDRYVTPMGDPGVTLVKGSEWRFFNYVSVDSAAGLNFVVIVGKIMLPDGSLGTEFVNTTSEVITVTAVPPQYTQTRAAVGRMYLNATDRIAMEYYGKTTSASARTLTLYHGGTEYATHFSTYT